MPLEDIDEYLFAAATSTNSAAATAVASAAASGAGDEAALRRYDAQQLLETDDLLQQRATAAAEMVLGLRSRHEQRAPAVVDAPRDALQQTAADATDTSSSSDYCSSVMPAASAETIAYEEFALDVTTAEASIKVITQQMDLQQLDTNKKLLQQQQQRKEEEVATGEAEAAAAAEECPDADCSMPPIDVGSYKGMLPPPSFFKIICIAPEEEDDAAQSQAEKHSGGDGGDDHD